MIKAIIFDIGGVITHGDFNAVYAGFAERFGIDGTLVAEFYRTNLSKLLTGHITTRDTREAFGLNDYSDEEILQVWKEVTLQHSSVDVSMLELLAGLRGRYTLVALSNLTESRYVADREMSIYDSFDHVVLSFQESMKKPDPAFFQCALTRAGVMPEEAFFIDDYERNVAAAEALGITGITFTSPQNLRGTLVECGVVL